MKRYIKVFALILAAIMMASFFVGCKDEKKEQFVGKVNGVVIPDGVFINYFFNVFVIELQCHECLFLFSKLLNFFLMKLL